MRNSTNKDAQQHALALQGMALCFGFVEAFLALRLLFGVINNNPSAGFASLVYGVTDILLAPFFALTAITQNSVAGLDLAAFVAMFAYGAIFWALLHVAWHAFNSTTAAVVYKRREE